MFILSKPLRRRLLPFSPSRRLTRSAVAVMGRGQGEPLVDRLLVLVAHEQFSKVVALAKDSPLIQGNVEQVSESDVKEIRTPTEVPSVVLESVAEEIRQNEVVMQAVAKEAEAQVAKLSQIETVEAVCEKIVEKKTGELVGALSKETIGTTTFFFS